AQDSNGEIYVTILEAGQAEKAGQKALFEQIGLSIKERDQIAFFNTNMAIFNFGELAPRLQALVAEVGMQKFREIISPDLIRNGKTQTDTDGVQRRYTQLEGAMGSSLLNLDRYWRSRYGEPLVRFINVERESRTRFFSPIKTAFDFYMQFH